jgi:hypothetical protein
MIVENFCPLILRRAQIWPPEEAISVWAEVVETRKHHITTSAKHANLPVLLAGQCVIAREQLAEWDSSARAWLRRAEQVMKKQQTQVLLICSNINLPVNTCQNTYDNVIEGWKTTLQAMEDLLSGQSQMANDGSMLLALTSWHLYPDMIVSRRFLVFTLLIVD